MTWQWKRWSRQAWVIYGMELRRNILTRRGWWIWLLAMLPPAITWTHAIIEMRTGRLHCTLARDTLILASVYHFMLLRAAIFFGCVGIFVRLFRAEILERTLHYYFLAPVLREIVLAAKFFAGLTTAVILLGGSTILTFAGMYAHYSPADVETFLWQNEGLRQLAAYVGVTALACVGYGAVFLAMGMLFHNPVFPAIAVWVWEAMHFLLPAWLKKVSVIFYLKSILPVAVPVRGPLALLNVHADPVEAWAAVAGMIAFTMLTLALGAAQARRMEIRYSAD